MYIFSQSARAARSALLKTACSLLILAAAGCAEGGETPEFPEADGAAPWTPPPANQDSAVTPWNPDNWTPTTQNDSSVVVTQDAGGSDASYTADAGSADGGTKADGGPDLGGLLGGLGGLLGNPDAGTPVKDPNTKPAEGAGPDNPAGWKLEPGSAPECPAVPPPIPVLGGVCVGVYWTCNWTNAQGQKYFCTCDWIHYLCI